MQQHSRNENNMNHIPGSSKNSPRNSQSTSKMNSPMISTHNSSPKQGNPPIVNSFDFNGIMHPIQKYPVPSIPMPTYDPLEQFNNHSDHPVLQYNGPSHMGNILTAGPFIAKPEAMTRPRPPASVQAVAPNKRTAEETVDITDKSCGTCRARKVRCDRVWPRCKRCTHRSEPKCDYGPNVTYESKPLSEAFPPPKRMCADKDVNARNQVPQNAQLVYPLLAVHHPSVLIPDNRHPMMTMNPGQCLGSDYYSAFPAMGQFPAEPYALVPNSEVQSNTAVNDIQSLWNAFVSNVEIGHRSVDWKLAKPAMASSLTDHLLGASLHSCCFHLKGFSLLKNRINFFRGNLNNLSLPDLAAVTILTSLGARASPHSALLGVTGPDPNDTPNSATNRELLLTAGRRRETAWRAIMTRAVDLCSSLAIMAKASRENIEILSAITNALLFSETTPDQSRFFHNTAISLYRDLERSEKDVEKVRSLKKTLGPILYESDCRLAAYVAQPALITNLDLREAWGDSGVRIPDISQIQLSVELEQALKPGPITRAKVEQALTLAGYYVCATQRSYSSMVTTRNSHAYLQQFYQHWRNIDRVHHAVQLLHGALARIAHVPSCVDNDDGDGHSLEYEALICVRLDIRVVDLVNLGHVFLLEQRKILAGTQYEKNLEDLLVISEIRVRKSLKLIAFFAKIFVDSCDRHVLYHLFLQLDVLPWIPMAIQKYGDIGGPSSPNYEMSSLELDWLVEGLKLACFYTPLASDRLRELEWHRQARNHAYKSVPTQPSNFESMHDFAALHGVYSISPDPEPNYAAPPVLTSEAPAGYYNAPVEYASTEYVPTTQEEEEVYDDTIVEVQSLW